MAVRTNRAFTMTRRLCVRLAYERIPRLDRPALGPARLTERATFDRKVRPRRPLPPDRIRPRRGSNGFSERSFISQDPMTVHD